MKSILIRGAFLVTVLAVSGLIGTLVAPAPLWAEDAPATKDAPADPQAVPKAQTPTQRFLERHGMFAQRQEFNIGKVRAAQAHWFVKALDHQYEDDPPLIITACVLTAPGDAGAEKVFAIGFAKPESNKTLGGSRYIDLSEAIALVDGLTLLRRQASESKPERGETSSFVYVTQSGLRFCIARDRKNWLGAVNCGDEIRQRIVPLQVKDLDKVKDLVLKAATKLRERGG